MARTTTVTDGMQYRTFAVESTFDDETRTVKDAIAATENPVLMPDWERMEMIPEVLLMSGVKFPESRTVPLLDNHKRNSNDDVLGSSQELRTDGGKLLMSPVFSSAAGNTWTKVKEGHIRDLSAGYAVEKKRFVAPGKTEQISGRSFTGPVNVVTSWRLREVSVTPIGADEQAKMRGLKESPFSERKLMLTKEQRDKLVARGMPVETTDEAAVQWAIENPVTVRTDVKQTDIKSIVEEATRKAVEETQRKQQEFADEVRFLTDIAGVGDIAGKLIENNSDIASVRKAIRDEKVARQSKLTLHPAFIESGPSQREKLNGVLGTAMTHRALSGCKLSEDAINRVFPKEQRQDGWEDFKFASLFDLARTSVEYSGINTRGMTREQIAKLALGFGQRSGGLHVTADFPNLTLDAINKTLLAGYTEAQTTWRICFRQAASVPDFKNIYRLRMSEAPNLSIWPDNTRPEEITFTDEKEQYAVEAYSNIASFSYRSLVNDDMDSLSRVPQLMGVAAARTINALVWSVVTANANLQDGQPLFSAATGNRKKNNIGTTGVISETTLGEGRQIMRTQVGVNTKQGNASPAILNLSPRYLVVPAAKETTAMKYVSSEYLPESNVFQVVNQFKNLIPVVEPLLDANSATAWYLFADPSTIDTVECTFLQGHETPVTDSWMDPETSAQKYRITQTAAAKAIDFRGCFKNAG